MSKRDDFINKPDLFSYDVVPYSVDLAYAMMARARVTRKVSLPALASR